MKSPTWIWLLLIIVILTLPAPRVVANDGRPNLLMILVDDLGYGDLGCYGAEDLETPLIDRLVKQGMKNLNRPKTARCFGCASRGANVIRASVISPCDKDLGSCCRMMRTSRCASYILRRIHQNRRTSPHVTPPTHKNVSVRPPEFLSDGLTRPFFRLATLIQIVLNKAAAGTATVQLPIAFGILLRPRAREAFQMPFSCN